MRVYSTGCSDLRNATLKPDAFLLVNPLPLAKLPQTDEPDLPFHLRLNGFARERHILGLRSGWKISRTSELLPNRLAITASGNPILGRWRGTFSFIWLFC